MRAAVDDNVEFVAVELDFDSAVANQSWCDAPARQCGAYVQSFATLPSRPRFRAQILQRRAKNRWHCRPRWRWWMTMRCVKWKRMRDCGIAACGWRWS